MEIEVERKKRGAHTSQVNRARRQGMCAHEQSLADKAANVEWWEWWPLYLVAILVGICSGW